MGRVVPVTDRHTSARGRFENWADQKRQEIRDAFQRVDTIGSGSVDAAGFITVAGYLNYVISEEDVNQILAEDGTGRIEMDKFVLIMTNKFIEKGAEEELLKAFNIIDQDRNGKVSAADIQRISKELGINFTEREIQDMVDEADRDRDGEVNSEEFMRMMRRTSYA